MSTPSDRCNTSNFSFGTSDNIDLSTLKDFDIGSDSYTYLNSIKNAKKDYENTNWLTGNKGCKVYEGYTSKQKEKIPKKLAKCSTYRKTMADNTKLVFESMSKGIKKALTQKVSYLNKNVKEQRLKNISCYVKLQDAVLKKCGKSLSVQSIIQEFKGLYQEQSELAEAYAKNIFYNRKDSSEILAKLNEITSIKPSFSESLTKILDKYDCTSPSITSSTTTYQGTYQGTDIERLRREQLLRKQRNNQRRRNEYNRIYGRSYV